MIDRLAHRVSRSSQATPAAVDKSHPRLTHRNPDNSRQSRLFEPTVAQTPSMSRARRRYVPDFAPGHCCNKADRGLATTPHSLPISSRMMMMSTTTPNAPLGQ